MPSNKLIISLPLFYFFQHFLPKTAFSFPPLFLHTGRETEQTELEIAEYVELVPEPVRYVHNQTDTAFTRAQGAQSVWFSHQSSQRPGPRPPPLPWISPACRASPPRPALDLSRLQCLTLPPCPGSLPPAGPHPPALPWISLACRASPSRPALDLTRLQGLALPPCPGSLPPAGPHPPALQALEIQGRAGG